MGERQRMKSPFKLSAAPVRSSSHVCYAKSEGKHAMNKRQLIDEIRRINSTAHPQFLAQFDEAALRQYLQHLEGARQKHLRIAGWVRKTPRLRIAI